MGREADDFEFVQLERTFHELSRQERDSDEHGIAETFHVRGNLTWSDILKDYRTVILSEAGSGKTEEIRQAAKRLRAEGKAAFFLRLEHVASNFDDAFEAGSIEEFETWLKSGDEGWLFLDSIDEARLKSPLDFASAVRKLGTRVKVAVQRAHVIITGRTHAWRAKSDAQLCESQFPFRASTQTISKIVDEDPAEDPVDAEQKLSATRTERPVEPIFKIVALDDLDRDQIKRFAWARGVSDTKALLSDFERADAWSFATRPQDLDEVISFWLENGRIGRRLELMQASIDRRLTERSQDRAETNPMSIEKARGGARLTAAAATLTHVPNIQVPDGTENQQGIRLQEVLPDWDDRNRSTLLSFPVFDEAIYATVRFHHRSVREYLTADWLAGLLRKSVSRRAVEALLFKNQYGLEVVIPTMRPVLPWLTEPLLKVIGRPRRIGLCPPSLRRAP